MNVDDEIKGIKEQVSVLCNQFNNNYPEFLNNEERIKSFSDVFNSLDYLNGILICLILTRLSIENRLWR